MRPLENWFLRRWRAEALSFLPQRGRLLEVGAGSGLNFAHYPSEVRGVASELSGAMLAIAQAKQPKHISLVQNRAEALPFRADVFDGALATLVFCSVASPAAAFAELRRVVKPGGTIVLLDHVRPAGMLGWVFDLLNIVTARLCDDHFNRRTAEEAQAAALKVERLDRKALGIFNLIVLTNPATTRNSSPPPAV
jgi:ubiquinone/menaquinone biosynthesis C-methylase UbiE